MDNKPDPLEELRSNQNFRAFAEQKMAEDGDFWRRESSEGSGFMRSVATAIIAVNNEDAPEKYHRSPRPEVISHDK